MDEQLPADEYAGPAVIAPAPVVEMRAPASLENTEDDDAVEVEATLRGHFEPLDGRFHWYGRLAAHEALGRLRPGTDVLVTTPHGSAAGRLSDLDPWGRLRISGTGRPPF